MRHVRSRLAATTTLMLLSLCAAKLNAVEGAIGDFEAQADVGKVDPPGTAQFDKDKAQYRLTSSGANIWGDHDDFHFVYRKVTAGDVALTADVAFVGEGKNAHRKAACMIRQSLDADAPYVDAVVHGDGSIALQHRDEKGGVTTNIKSTVKAPATLRLERRGDEFIVSISPKAGEKSDVFQIVGSVKLALKGPVCAGLVLSAHDAAATETAVFSAVTIRAGAEEPKK